ncbi:NTE family protein [Thiothrix eikelboomii]|uniref:NTE family protein n=1 Tax=Thiothrix eikelboomii TaxID=92487 RepID=A0A1T4XCZ2_9GAMM|nr:patatin-like phospholipase family protein [Thiothrix eikelboomii]SKA87277.1 NTE family protein [Thiothrix eikelboomii]
MMRFTQFLVFILSLSLGLVGLSPAQAANQAPQKRPRIGLVLGGGGAAGIAHVGVLKVLEEQGVPIDVIAGTSMGAIVGSLYAAGYKADELEKVVSSLDWPSLFEDQQPRDMQSFQLKRDNAGFFNTAEVGIKDHALKLPDGLVSGQKLMFELRRLLERVAQIDDFDRLPIPFRAVATDIETGEQVVLRKGNLATAVRASMSIPGFFSPIVIDDRLLVDGFVSNNVPVDVARQMGADILIVVSLPYYFEKRDQLNSAVAVTVQAMQFLTAKNSLPQLKGLNPPNIVIEPDLQDIGSLSFGRVQETIPIGEKAARAQLGAIKRLAAYAPPSSPTQAQQQVDVKPGAQGMQEGRVAKVILENNSRLQDSVVLQRLGIQAGDALDVAKLQRGLDNVHSLGYFDIVDYNLVPSGKNAYDLHIIARQRSTGDQRLRFGFTLDDNFEGDASYQVGVRHVLKGATRLGTEWRNSLVVGDRFHAETQVLHPLNDRQGAFLDARAWHDRQDFYTYLGKDRSAEVRLGETGVEANWRLDVGTASELSIGGIYRNLTPDTKTGKLSFPGESLQIAGLEFAYSTDTLNDADFPNHGQWLQAEYTRGVKVLGADVEFNRVKIAGGKVWTEGKHRLAVRGQVGSTLRDDAFITEQLSLGGYNSLSGLSPNQLRGNHAALGRGSYMYELVNYPGVAKIYAGGSLELGNTWEKSEDVGWGNLLLSGSLFVGMDSPIGPAFMGIGQTEGYEPSLFMHVGRSF